MILRLNGSCNDAEGWNPPDQELIKLNIGGHNFTTTLATLTRFQDTLFSNLLASGSKCPLGICEDGLCLHQPVTMLKNDTGAVFFDRG